MVRPRQCSRRVIAAMSSCNAGDLFGPLRRQYPGCACRHACTRATLAVLGVLRLLPPRPLAGRLARTTTIPASRSSAAERDCARRARRTHRNASTCTIPVDASPCIRNPLATFNASNAGSTQPLESGGRKTTHVKRTLLLGMREEDRSKKR